MATTQKLSTELILEAVVSSDFTDAFSTANKLMNDLSKHSNALERDLADLGKSADHLDSIGDSSKELRRDMARLEKQISETHRAVDKFSDARQHFRNARLGASALKNELSDLVSVASKAALSVAAIGTGAAVALSPSEETLAFGDQLARLEIIPEMDEVKLDAIKKQLLDISNLHVDIALPDLTNQFNKLSRKFSIEDAQGLLPEVANFQTITGKSITGDFQTDHDALVAALNITTADQYKELLGFLSKSVVHGNLNLDNIDPGDLGTIIESYGTDLNSKDFQEALFVALKHKELDSEQYADKFREFLTRRNEATFIPEFDSNISSVDDLEKVLKQQETAQKNIQTLAKYGLGEGSTLNDLGKLFIGLQEEERKQLIHDLEPIFGGEIMDVLVSAPQGLQTIYQDAENVANVEMDMQENADKILGSWSKVWRRIGVIGEKTTGLLQEQFAKVFGPPIVAGAERLFNFLQEHEADIEKFFTGVKDTLSPIIKKVSNAVVQAWPGVQKFALEVWDELRSHWESIAPVAGWLADKVWSFVKAVGGFLRDHPKLVATVLAGIAAWKSYKIASTAVQTGYDFIAGGVSMLQGHYHRLTAEVLGNQRELANTGNVAVSTGKKFLDMGRNLLATKFPRFGTVISGLGKIGTSALGTLPGIVAMGSALWGAMAPILPIVIPIVAVIAAVAAGGYLVYKNWDGISDFFARHFETIRNVLMFVFPPLGMLIGLAGVIKQNWEPLKEFFSTLWETVKLAASVVWEGIKFIVLGTLVTIKNIWSGITGFFSDIWGGVKGVFMDSPLAPLFKWMSDGVKKVVSPLLGFFSNFWDNISSMAGRVIGWITDKFDKFNKILNKWFGWLSNKNKEMKEELGFKSEAKVDSKIVDARVGTDKVTESPTVITPEAKNFIKETYDVNLDKLPVDFAKELSSGLIGIGRKTEMVSTPEELQQVNVIKQHYLNEINMAMKNTEDEQEKNALEKVAVVLEKDLSVDTLSSDMDFAPPTEYIQQVIQGDSLLKPLSDIHAEQQKQTALLELFRPKEAVVETETPAPVSLPEQTQEPLVNVEQMTQQQPVVNVPKPTLPDLNIEKPVIEQRSPVVNLPQTEKPVIIPGNTVVTQEQPIVNQQAPVIEMPAQAGPIVNLPTQEQPIINQQAPVVEIPAQSGPIVNLPEQQQPIINPAQQTIQMPAQAQPIVNLPEQDTPVIGGMQPVINIPEGTQPVIDVAQPTLQDFNIPDVEIPSPDGTVLNVEQVMQEQPSIEMPETMPYTPVPTSPTGTPTAPQTTQIHNETANTDSGTVNITFHMNITQAPGEDGEAFAERVAALIRKELNSAPDGFLTQ